MSMYQKLASPAFPSFSEIVLESDVAKTKKGPSYKRFSKQTYNINKM